MYLYQMKWFIFLAFVYFKLNAAVFGQEIIKSWEVPPYEVQLIRYEQVKDNGGIDIDQIKHPRESAPNYHTTFSVFQDGKAINGAAHIRVSNDSCELNFIDLGAQRNLTGVLGHDITLNLCTKKKIDKLIEKPSWLLISIDSAFIKDLVSDSVQKCHPKMNEALKIFTTHQYTVLRNKYIPSEWKAPYQPRYQITVYQGAVQHEVLLYYDMYIIDGYLYSAGNNQGTQAEDLHFWQSNLKLLQRDLLIEQNSKGQH